MGGYFLLSSVWAGVFGYFFYAERDGSWAFKTITLGYAEAYQFCAGFALLPTLLLVAFVNAFALAGRRQGERRIGWPVYPRFWIFFSLTAFFTFGIGMSVSFAPIMANAGAKMEQMIFFGLCHAINGFVISLTAGTSQLFIRKFAAAPARP